MNDGNIWRWERKRHNAHLKVCLFNPLQNWTINSICMFFFFFEANLHHCNFLSWCILPHTIYEARGSQNDLVGEGDYLLM